MFPWFFCCTYQTDCREWILHTTAVTPQIHWTRMFLNVLLSGVVSGTVRGLEKKMLISLGGDTCDGSLGTALNAKKLAYYIWNLFLGGKEMQDKRPFLWWEMRNNLSCFIVLILSYTIDFPLSIRNSVSAAIKIVARTFALMVSFMKKWPFLCQRR